MAWYPGAKVNRASKTGGSYVAGYPWRFVFHTVEGSSFSPGSSYYGHSSWPHFTLERDGTLWQHIDTGVAARALVNNSGGEQTNRARAIQIEIVGFAREMPDGLAEAQRQTLARLLKWVRDTHGVPLDDRGVDWRGSDAYGTSAPQRLSQAAWRNFHGLCGHQHVPEGNTHWDPGNFGPALRDVLARTGTTIAVPRPQKEWFEMAIPKKDLERIAKAVWGGTRFGGIDLPHANTTNKSSPWQWLARLVKTQSTSRGELVDALDEALSEQGVAGADAEAIVDALAARLAE